MKKFVSNLMFAFGAQAIAMVSSMLISLVLPKLLGVEEFSYWQLFIFYSTYVGMFHFGLSDGLYLKYGGTKIQDMDKNLIGSQIRFMVIWQTAICAILLAVLPFYIKEQMRMFVWIIVCLYLVIMNLMAVLGYIFQAGNETKLYSISNMISKLLFIAFIVASIIIKNKNVKTFLVFYLVAQGVATLFSIYKGRQFIFCKWIGLKNVIKETFGNMKIGINMTISVIASSLILGFGRAFVDSHWSITAFGIFSLAISLTNFILQFIQQVSMVMFPALRQVGDEQKTEIYLLLRKNIGIIFCGALIFYAPVRYILLLWLPNYAESLSYLAIILPICVFDGKMQMLYNTYLKVLRKERQMLYINLVSCAISFFLCLISTYILNSIIAVVFAMIISIAVRSIIASCYLSKSMNMEMEKNLFIEIALCSAFIILNRFLDIKIAFILYLCCYIGVMFAYRNHLVSLFHRLIKRNTPTEG